MGNDKRHGPAYRIRTTRRLRRRLGEVSAAGTSTDARNRIFAVRRFDRHLAVRLGKPRIGRRLGAGRVWTAGVRAARNRHGDGSCSRNSRAVFSLSALLTLVLLEQLSALACWLRIPLAVRALQAESLRTEGAKTIRADQHRYRQSPTEQHDTIHWMRRTSRLRATKITRPAIADDTAC